MSRKPGPRSIPKVKKQGAGPPRSSPQGSTTTSIPPEQPAAADEWIITQVGGIVERLGCIVVLGSRGHKIRQLTIDEVVSYCTVRAASKPEGIWDRGDMAVWKGPRLHAYLRGGAKGCFKVHEIK